ncbi:MAG: MoxR family ATPase, partial [Polyangiaceae bacterium]
MPPATAPYPSSGTAADKVRALEKTLAGVGYLADDRTALAAFLAMALDKPLLVEGPAGVGKTDLARALAEGLGR